MFFRVPSPEVDESDFAASDSESLAHRVDIALVRNLYECLANGADAKAALECHFNGFLVAYVSFVRVSDEKNPDVAGCRKVDRIFVQSYCLVKLGDEAIELGGLVSVER